MADNYTSYLVVEDGSGLPNANSYVSLANTDIYFTERNNQVWLAAEGVDKDSALIRATDYVDIMYEFAGVRASAEQALEWPRNNAYDVYGTHLTGVPRVLERVVMELAVRALQQELLPDNEYSGKIKRERIEGVVEIEYAQSGAFQTPTFNYIDRLIQSMGIGDTRSGLGNLQIVRY